MIWYTIIFGGQFFFIFFFLFYMLNKVFTIKSLFGLHPLIHIFAWTIVSGTAFTFITLYFELQSMVYFSSIYSACIASLFIWVYIKDHKLPAMVTMLNYVMICLTIHYLVGYTNFALAQIYPDLIYKLFTITPWPWSYSLLTTALCLLIHYLVTLFVIRYPMNFAFRKLRYLLFALIQPFLYFFCLRTLQHNFDNIPVQLTPFLLAMFLVLNMFLYYMYTKLMKEYQEKVNFQLISYQSQTQLQYVRNMQVSYEEMRKLKHDMKNHLLYMDWLLSDKNYDGLHAYYQKVNAQFASAESVVHTENQLVNAVLNLKIADAAAKKIDISVHAEVPEEIALQDNHLCAVLLNLMDNAIEASAEISDPYIKIDIRIVKAYLSVEIANRVEHDILKKNPSLSTTKQDKTEHGMGIKIVRDIIRYYDGVLKFYMEDDFFTANILLDNRSALLDPAQTSSENRVKSLADTIQP